MTFHKEGYPSIFLVLIVSAIINYLTHTFLSDYPGAIYIGYAVSAFLILVILQFFRSPNRTVTQNENHVISPCDGKVVVIEEVQETEFINEKESKFLFSCHQLMSTTTVIR